MEGVVKIVLFHFHCAKFYSFKRIIRAKFGQNLIFRVILCLKTFLCIKVLLFCACFDTGLPEKIYAHNGDIIQITLESQCDRTKKALNPLFSFLFLLEAKPMYLPFEVKLIFYRKDRQRTKYNYLISFFCTCTTNASAYF